MAMNLGSQVVNTYPLSNYTFENKDKMVRGKSYDDYMARWKHSYENDGMRTTVAGILLVHKDNYPLVLLLKITKSVYMIPGGRLKPGEDETEGLKRKLTSKLGSTIPNYVPDWQIDQCLAVWWRPNFEKPLYPYCPPHITKPKECTKLFLVHLPEWAYFEVPKNSNLVAIPLCQLFDNAKKYGLVISAIPEYLSRFSLRRITD